MIEMTHLDHILIQLFICYFKNNFLKFEFNFMAEAWYPPQQLWLWHLFLKSMNYIPHILSPRY